MTPERLRIRWDKGAAKPVAPVSLGVFEGLTGFAPPPSQAACDFCGNQGVESAVFAVFEGVRGKITRQEDGREWWVDGPFGACRACQSRLGITPGDEEVALAKVRRLFDLEIQRQTIFPATSDFYGPG